MNESYDSNAEKSGWEQQLYDAALDKARELRDRRSRESFTVRPGYELRAPDGTAIRMSTFQTSRDNAAYAAHGMVEGNLFGDSPSVKGAYDMLGYDGSKFFHSMHQAHDVPGMLPEERPRLAFVVETKPGGQAANAYTASSHGEVERPVEAAHYEGFVDPAGSFVGLYKLGKEQQLEPVDDAEGERLAWQMANCELI